MDLDALDAGGLVSCGLGPAGHSGQSVEVDGSGGRREEEARQVNLGIEK